MGGVEGRGAGGGSRELLPLTRFRLGVEFRGPEDPGPCGFCSLWLLSGGDGSVGSPTHYCFLLQLFI